MNIYKISINEYRNMFYFIWDNKDKTIDMVNEYLKSTRNYVGAKWLCGRCDDHDTLFISECCNGGTSSSFYSNSKYVVDFGASFWGIDKEYFDV